MKLATESLNKLSRHVAPIARPHLGWDASSAAFFLRSHLPFSALLSPIYICLWDYFTYHLHKTTNYPNFNLASLWRKHYLLCLMGLDKFVGHGHPPVLVEPVKDTHYAEKWKGKKCKRCLLFLYRKQRNRKGFKNSRRKWRIFIWAWDKALAIKVYIIALHKSRSQQVKSYQKQNSYSYKMSIIK